MREQSGANNRPAAALLFGQRDPTMAKQSLQRSGEKLAESAEEIKLSTYGVEDSAERTTQLAADRTVFAAERTYVFWGRSMAPSRARRASTANRCVAHPALGFGRRKWISRTRGTRRARRHMVWPACWRVKLKQGA